MKRQFFVKGNFKCIKDTATRKGNLPNVLVYVGVCLNLYISKESDLMSCYDIFSNSKWPDLTPVFTMNAMRRTHQGHPRNYTASLTAKQPYLFVCLAVLGANENEKKKAYLATWGFKPCNTTRRWKMLFSFSPSNFGISFSSLIYSKKVYMKNSMHFPL